MSVAILVVTDGRDEYLTQCVASLDHLHGPISEWWMFDDTGDDDYRARLAARYPRFRHVHGGPRRGFGGAIRHAWAHMAHSSAQWVWHMEQDFVLRRPVDLDVIVTVLTARPHLAQMALRRQPWSPPEIAAGGVVEQRPHDYTEEHDALTGASWLEHRLFWTTNPGLYRRSLISVGWPDVPRSEGMFTSRLLRYGTADVPGPLVRFGYWGARASGEWVRHIGHDRVGSGY